jgi:hypothetical protein
MAQGNSRLSRRQFVQGVGGAGLTLGAGRGTLSLEVRTHTRQMGAVYRIGFLQGAVPNNPQDPTWGDGVPEGSL